MEILANDFGGIYRKTSAAGATKLRAGQQVDTSEITLEIAHAFFVNPNLIVQPDVQYVIHPGTIQRRHNALVLGIRLEFNVNWFNPSKDRLMG